MEISFASFSSHFQFSRHAREDNPRQTAYAQRYQDLDNAALFQRHEVPIALLRFSDPQSDHHCLRIHLLQFFCDAVAHAGQ